MSKIRVLICRVDDENPDTMTELGSYDLPEIGLPAVNGQTTLDAIEQATHEQGQRILRGVVQAQWTEIDQALANEYRQHFSPSGGDE